LLVNKAAPTDEASDTIEAALDQSVKMGEPAKEEGEKITENATSEPFENKERPIDPQLEGGEVEVVNGAPIEEPTTPVISL